MKRFNLHIGAFLTLALAVSSCAEEELVKDYFVPTPSNTITFGASDLKVEVRSRSGKSNNAILSTTESKLVSEDGQYSLPMLVQVQEGIHRIGEAAPASRGNKMQDIGDITTLHAWATHTTLNATNLYIKGTAGDVFAETGNIYSPATEGTHYMWPSDGTLDFMTVANKPATFTPNFNDANTEIVSFNYTVPANAANQPDILIAQASASADAGEGENPFGVSVPLDFKHIMAAVNVKVGTINENVNGVIKSVKLKNIYNQGTYQVENHVWVGHEAVGEFNVNLSSKVDGVDVGEVTGELINTSTFMMLPQFPGPGALIEVVFDPNDRTDDVILEASVQGHNWAINTTTTYLLNIDGSYNLKIVPEESILDSHYIMTNVRVSSEYANWTLDVYDTTNNKDDDGNLIGAPSTWGNESDITIQLNSDLNPMAKLGFWTDRKLNKDTNGNYIKTDIYARGGKQISGTNKVTDLLVTVFIPENISGSARDITLVLKNTNDSSIKKILTLTQNSVVWFNPATNGLGGNSDQDWGCELIIEGGRVPWGFCWDDEYIDLYSSHGNWKEGDINNIPPGQVPKIEEALAGIGMDVEAMRLSTNFIQLQQEKKGYWFIRINLGLLGNITIAESTDNGWANTDQLYHWKGIESLSTMLGALSTWSGIDNPEAIDEAGLENSLDYATLYAMKRNKFDYFTQTVDIDGYNMTLDVPVILDDNDINWYLPAVGQFETLKNSGFINTDAWNAQFGFNENYWTSTSYIPKEGETNNAHSYAYINGVPTVEYRRNPHLTMALRLKE